MSEMSLEQLEALWQDAKGGDRHEDTKARRSS
jgi:hypothetical protein